MKYISKSMRMCIYICIVYMYECIDLIFEQQPDS